MAQLNLHVRSLGADYMEIFNLDWDFNSLNWVEISTRHTELKFLHVMAMSFQRGVYYLAEMKFHCGTKI